MTYATVQDDKIVHKTDDTEDPTWEDVVTFVTILLIVIWAIFPVFPFFPH